MTEITLIPHDGGPCPVEGDCLVMDNEGEIFLLRNNKKGMDLNPLFVIPDNENPFIEIGEYWHDIIAYCQIEIKEGE